MKNHTCNVCGASMEDAQNEFGTYISWKIPNSPKAKYKGRTLRAQVEVKFRVTASAYMLDDVNEDTDICNDCIKRYLPTELTKMIKK
jgi:hypothetical protein